MDKSLSPAAATPTEDVIDLTEGLAGLSSQKGKSRVRDTSPPRSLSQTLGVPEWEEYRSPITGVGLRAFLVGYRPSRVEIGAKFTSQSLGNNPL